MTNEVIVVKASVSGTLKFTVHDLEVMGSKPGWVKFRVHDACMKVVLES